LPHASSAVPPNDFDSAKNEHSVVRLELGNAVLKKVICTSGKLLEFHNIYPPETFRGDDGARAPNSTGAPSVVKVTDLRALMTSKLICVQRVPEEKAKLS
jgi:hypothetical protein